MRTRTALMALPLCAVLLAGCNSEIEDTEGSVLIQVTEVDGQPVRFSVNSNLSLLQITSITITSIPKDPGSATSELQSVRLDLYEVRYRRIGAGSRAPSALVRRMNGFVEPGGTFTIDNLPVMAADQLENPPLSDLLFENGAFDPETNSQTITLELTIQFFGESLSGDELATNPVSFVIEFVP